MIKKILSLCCGMMAIATFCNAQEQAAPSVPQPKVFDPKRPPVHDPVTAKDGDTYYVFGTGPGISTLNSKDLKTWEKGDPVFDKNPEWVKEALPDRTTLRKEIAFIASV